MIIEAITVCVNYADILALVIGHNKTVINNWIIVTDTKDRETKKLCDYHNVRCIQTDVFYENGNTFNKGKGINAGFDQLKKNGWIMHLDADILLPANFKSILESDDLEIDCIYSMDRIDLIGREAYVEKIINMHNQYSDYVFVEEKLPISTRMFHNKMGYCTIGYLQLFHSLKFEAYSEKHQTAARSDVLFLNKWAKNKRRLHPGCFVYHIMSENSPMGTNWDGRKSKQF
jgi:hypothetical protein